MRNNYVTSLIFMYYQAPPVPAPPIHSVLQENTAHQVAAHASTVPMATTRTVLVPQPAPSVQQGQNVPTRTVPLRFVRQENIGQ